MNRATAACLLPRALPIVHRPPGGRGRGRATLSFAAGGRTAPRSRTRGRTCFFVAAMVLVCLLGGQPAAIPAIAQLPPSEISLSAGAVIPRGTLEGRDRANVGFVLSGGYGFHVSRRLQLGLSVAHLGLTGDEIAGEGIVRYNRRFTVLQAAADARLQLLTGATTPYLKASLGLHRWSERFLVREIAGGDADYFGAQKAEASDLGFGVGFGCQLRIGRQMCGLLETMWQQVDRTEAEPWRYTEMRAGFVFQLGPGTEHPTSDPAQGTRR